MLLFMFNPILIAAAVIPAIILLVRVYRADRLEREPIGLLVSLVLYGIISTLLATGAEYLGEFLLDIFSPRSRIAYNLWMYFVVVGCSEEGAKYIVLKKRTWRSPDFNCQFDGMVYAISVSLGFALWENIRYVLSYGLGTALLRAATAVPGHACFGVFMGAFYGIAKRFERGGDERSSKLAGRFAFIVPTLMHGAYDFIASIENTDYGWTFFVFVAVLFGISLLLVKKFSKNDRYI